MGQALAGELTKIWRLMRLDDNGNEFEMARFDDPAEAERERAKYEKRGHKQTYYLKQKDRRP